MTDATLSCEGIVAAMHEGSYERNEQDFMRLLVHHGMHVVDVGAHIGFHTRHLADLVGPNGSVTAFEPVAEHVAVLSDTIQKEGWQGRVLIVQAAVADVQGSRTMVIATANLAAANAYLEPETAQERHHARPEDHTIERQVAVQTLDDAVRQRPVAFLKIDAEGAEALVLRGARRLLAADHPVVLADLHPHLMQRLDGTTPEALIREMVEVGYECRLLGAGVAGPPIADVHARGVTTVVFQPCAGPSFDSRTAGV